MALRGARRRQGVDRGFVLSDHADWPGLQRAIVATGAQRVIVTNGQEAVMVRWLGEQGLHADSVRAEYGDEGGMARPPRPTPLRLAVAPPPPTPKLKLKAADLMRRFAALYAELDAATATEASCPSCWPMRWTWPAMTCRPAWARPATGWRNGSTTASGPRRCGVPAVLARPVRAQE